MSSFIAGAAKWGCWVIRECGDDAYEPQATVINSGSIPEPAAIFNSIGYLKP